MFVLIYNIYIHIRYTLNYIYFSWLIFFFHFSLSSDCVYNVISCIYTQYNIIYYIDTYYNISVSSVRRRDCTVAITSIVSCLRCVCACANETATRSLANIILLIIYRCTPLASRKRT